MSPATGPATTWKRGTTTAMIAMITAGELKRIRAFGRLGMPEKA
jgi:hypothetical protein